MKTSVNFWDWLFGEKISIQLSDGSYRMVTQKWIEQMEQQGLMKKIEKEVVTVHILDPLSDFLNKVASDTEQQDHYRQEFWVIGEDVPTEMVQKFRDPVTGDVYVLMDRSKSAGEHRDLL